MEREQHQRVQITFYVEFYTNRNYQQYRDALKNDRKDLLRGSNWWFSEFINFNDLDAVEKAFYQKNDEIPDNELAKKAIELYIGWKLDNKNIEEIINECSPKTI